jgi:hypothetical protein
MAALAAKAGSYNISMAGEKVKNWRRKWHHGWRNIETVTKWRHPLASRNRRGGAENLQLAGGAAKRRRSAESWPAAKTLANGVSAKWRNRRKYQPAVAAASAKSASWRRGGVAESQLSSSQPAHV